jgi:Uma2 family endonuclease
MAIATPPISSEFNSEVDSKITVEQYYRMEEAGMFHPEQRLELINGKIIYMSPIGRKHGSCVAVLTEIFVSQFKDKVFTWVQNSIQLNNLSEPQPDLALLKRRGDFYRDRLPIPNDILLIIEVADSTISYDRNVKIPLYGSAGIIEAWLIDVNEKTLTKYTQPNPEGYQSIEVFKPSDVIIWMEEKILLADILGD